MGIVPGTFCSALKCFTNRAYPATIIITSSIMINVCRATGSTFNPEYRTPKNRTHDILLWSQVLYRMSYPTAVKRGHFTRKVLLVVCPLTSVLKLVWYDCSWNFLLPLQVLRQWPSRCDKFHLLILKRENLEYMYLSAKWKSLKAKSLC